MINTYLPEETPLVRELYDAYDDGCCHLGCQFGESLSTNSIRSWDWVSGPQEKVDRDDYAYPLVDVSARIEMHLTNIDPSSVSDGMS